MKCEPSRAQSTSRAIIKVCPVCRKSFNVPHKRANSAKFCTVRCRGISSRRLVKSKCRVCGTNFELGRAAAARGEGRYCSRQCSHAAQSYRGRQLRACLYCGQQFRSLRSSTKKFCGKACVYKSILSRSDLRGKTFGRLYVLENAGRGSHGFAWRCRCECGRETIVRQDALIGGKTRSCGNHFASRLLGKRFGQLVVVERDSNTSSGKTRWRCRCDCGKTINVIGNSLVTGNTQSCGCLKIRLAKSDLQGRQVGRLLVVSEAPRPSHVRTKSIYWRCHCECGNTAVVSADSLGKALKGDGGARSCGCLNHELAAERMSREKNPRWKSNWSDQQRLLSRLPRRTNEYLAWCKEVYRREDYTCRSCRTRGGVLHAHHIDGWDSTPKKRYDPANGAVLCIRCHRSFHKRFGLGGNTNEQFEKFLSRRGQLSTLDSFG
jgi:hypothetical protein